MLNLRDIVVQGTTDEQAAPVDVFPKAWTMLQRNEIDNATATIATSVIME